MRRGSEKEAVGAKEGGRRDRHRREAEPEIRERIEGEELIVLRVGGEVGKFSHW